MFHGSVMHQMILNPTNEQRCYWFHELCMWERERNVK